MRIAEMIRVGDTVADIGTDHAYLPIYLIKSGISPKVFASDVAVGPLKNAQENLKKSGILGVELRLGDGLSSIKPFEADTFVIAGMGGDLIIKILEAAPWVKDERYELLIQPMTSAEDLRAYLLRSGFEIAEERAVRSAGRVYTVIKAKFVGKTAECDGLFYYIGKLCDNIGEDELVYIKRKRRIINALATDIKKVEGQEARYELLCKIVADIDKLLEQHNGN
jgi:tRNA (adenine22-N1)-methyltransferase